MSCTMSPIADAQSIPADTHLDLLSFAFDHPSPSFDKNKPIYIDPQCPARSLSASRTETLTKRLICGLRTVGLQNGECVLVHLYNSYLYSALYFGIIGAGAVSFGSNPSHHHHELEHMFALARPSVIITSPDLVSAIEKVAHGQGFPANRIYVLDETLFYPAQLDIPYEQALEDSDAYQSQDDASMSSGGSNDSCNVQCPQRFEHLLRYGEEDWIRMKDVETSKDTEAALFATSGTSGLPKLAPISHFALIQQHLVLYYQQSYPVVRLTTVPLFHSIGSLFGHLFPIRYGQPTYVLRRFEHIPFLHAVQQYGVTDVAVVPAILQKLGQSSLHARSYLNSLRSIICAGSILDAASQDKCYSYLPSKAVIAQLYGMTEFGCITSLRYPEKDTSGSVGKLLPGVEIKLVRDIALHSDNSAIEVGEAYVRGPGTTVMGYRSQASPTVTPIVDRDKWLRTGDIMRREGEKYYIIGRAKEIIKIRGWQVSPSEIESLLLLHPQISDVAVKGVLLSNGITEAVKAYVVRTNRCVSCGPVSCGTACGCLTEEEVYNFSRERLASYKAIDGGVVFVEGIPRTASGKVQRYLLP